MAVSAEEFRHTLASFASGVTVVTTVDAAGGLHGLTVSAFCSVSLDPPMVLVCIEKATASHYAFLESGRYAVNILSGDQAAVSEHFATPYPDKFEGVPFAIGGSGLPLLEDAMASLQCRIKDTYDGGDHTIFVGEVEAASVATAEPLVYFRGQYQLLKT